MKFRGNRQILLEAVSLVGLVVPLRSVKPILQNLRLIVDSSGATLLATDLEVAVRHHVPLDDVSEGGDVLVPVTRLAGILRESSSEDVTLQSEDRALRITCGDGSFKVLGEVPDDFPQVPEFDATQALTIGVGALRELIRKTSFATAREKSRYAFNGVRFEVEGDEARMIATDGKRLAFKRMSIENASQRTAGLIIPTKGLHIFDKILGDLDGTVQMTLEEKQVMLKTPHGEVSSRLVEGAFPRYQGVIPQETIARADFDRQALMSALRRSAILTNEESRAVRFNFEPDKLVITSRAMDVGESRVEIATKVEGSAPSVAFNPDFFVEGLRVMAAETVTMTISGKDTPARLDGEEDFIYVVMPVTLRSG